MACCFGVTNKLMNNKKLSYRQHTALILTLPDVDGQYPNPTHGCKTGYMQLYGWLRGTVVERRSLTGELSLSYARLAANG